MAVCWPYVRLHEVDVLFFRIADCIMGRVRWRAVLLKCPFVMTVLLGCQTTVPFQDDLTVGLGLY